MIGWMRFVVLVCSLGLAGLAVTAADSTTHAVQLADGQTKLQLEAPLPQGFPVPGALGEVILKHYPAHRAVWC